MSVLTWHQISDQRVPTAVAPERFSAQLDLLQDMGYSVVDLESAAAQAGRQVALTFDDGHLDSYTTAYPILASRGLTATIYIATRFVSTDEWFEPGSRPMTWTMVRELAAAGWTIGSHAASHRKLTTLDDPEIDRELRDSRRILEDRLGQECVHFCAPHGDMDRRVLARVRRAGYASAALSLPHRHPLPEDELIIPRAGIYRQTRWWVFRMKARGWDRWLRRAKSPEKRV